MQVIASKDALVREYHDELSAKNDNYVKVLQKQDEDTSALIEHMRQVCVTNQCHFIFSCRIEINSFVMNINVVLVTAIRAVTKDI